MGNVHVPIGLDVTKTGRVLARAFDDVLTAAGGSLATWQVLATLSQGDVGIQREIAAAIGIEGATLTHHLNGMETEGLITGEREPQNRRQHKVLVTEAGRILFEALLEQVVAFDGRLRRGLSAAEVSVMHDLLGRLRASATTQEPTDPGISTNPTRQGATT